jgi:2-polyprenyl-3-methyl-5-hydroxy-6-metoxy-1,4-benzoquinol methylase
MYFPLMQKLGKVEPCSLFDFKTFGKQRIVREVDQFILQISKDKSVLDIGCCGSDAATRQNPFHAKIAATASYALGIDLFEEGIKNFRSLGLNIELQNAEALRLKKSDFDLAIVSELIEHVSNPGRVLDSVYANIRIGGRILVTTPNPFGLGTMLRRLIRGNSSVNSDHVAWFDPVFLSFLLRRSGFEIEEILWMNSSENFFVRILQKFRPDLHRTIGVLAVKSA